ncbi:MAG: hypothetical protein Hens2KO_16020 [Henriciella sp.]
MGVSMIFKTFASLAIASAIGVSAAADTAQTADQGEVLAWTVAAYSSCESRSELQTEIREEASKLDASTIEIVAALRILAEASSVCGLKSLYAQEMLSLAETDMASFEARLLQAQPVNSPVFELETPKGPAAPNSIILTESAEVPPLSSTFPPSSDYKQ